VHRARIALLLLLLLLTPSVLPAARAGEERPLPQVEVLDAGRAPRRLLRMVPQPGTTQPLDAEVTLEQKLVVEGNDVPTQGAPGMRMRLDAGCGERSPNGDYVLRFVFRALRLLGEETAPSPERERFHRRMNRFDGTALLVHCNDRGMARFTTVELPDYFPPDMEQDLKVFRRSFEDWSYPLPESEVGVGARWRVVDVNDADGWVLHQTTTYDLRRLDDEGFEVGIAIEQTAEEQPMPADRLPPGASLKLLGCEGRGTGRYVQRFGEPVPRELSMDVATVLTQRLTVDGQTQRGRQDVRLQLAIRGGDPGPTPPERTWEAPSEAEALAVMQAVLAHVAAGEFAAAGRYLDTEALLRGIFGSRADTMPAAERKELLALLRESYAAHSFAFPQIHDGLANGDITLGAPEALPPRRDRILVRCKVKHANGEAEVGWVLHPTKDGPRLVDALTPNGAEVESRRSAYEAMSVHTGESPLVWLRRALGVPPRPGSADTLPPGGGRPEWASSDALALGIRPPVVPGAAADVACAELPPSPWLERITLHLTASGDVFFRPGGRPSHLARVTLATGSPAEQELGLRKLQSMLVDATSRPATRREDGVSRHRLLLHADARSRWQHVAWLARLAREGTVGIADVDLAVELPGGGYGVVPLPTGARDAPADDAVIRLTYRDAADRRGVTRVKLPGGTTLELPHAPAAQATPETEAAYGNALASLREALAAPGTKRWHVALPPPYGDRVPYEDVARVLQTLEDLGAERVEVAPAVLPWEDDPFGMEEPEEVEEGSR